MAHRFRCRRQTALLPFPPFSRGRQLSLLNGAYKFAARTLFKAQLQRPIVAHFINIYSDFDLNIYNYYINIHNN